MASKEWKEEEASVSNHIIDHLKTCYLESKRAYGKKLYSVCIYSSVNNYCFEWTLADESKDTFEWGFKKYQKNKLFFRKKDKDFSKVISEVKKLFKEIKEKKFSLISNKELKTLFVRLLEPMKRQYGYAILSEGADSLSESDYLKFLPNIEKDEALTVCNILATPEDLSFVEKAKLNLLLIAKKVFSNKQLKEVVFQKSIKAVKKFPDFFKELRKESQNYFWIQNSFRQAFYLDEKYFLNSLIQILKEKNLPALQSAIKKLKEKKRIFVEQRNEIYKKYKLPLKTKKFFEFIRYLTILQDRRKENLQKLVFCIDQLLNEVARRFKVNREDLNNYFVNDIIKILSIGKKVSEKELKQRNKVIFFSYLEKGKIRSETILGKRADVINHIFKKKREKLVSANIIKGFVASLGLGKRIIKGRVRIVFNPVKDTFRDGEILVTGMTRPEFVPLMRKAKAVITNEGGITTHAAIVSRELGIPCLIGTKIATEALRNDDSVEIDMDKGTVRIIK